MTDLYNNMLKAFRHGREYERYGVERLGTFDDLAEDAPAYLLPFAEWYNRLYGNLQRHIGKRDGYMRSMYKPARFKRLRSVARWMWLILGKRPMWLLHFSFTPCEHTHTFSIDLPENTPWFYKGERRGEHGSLVIEGCYRCDNMQARDTAV